MRFGWTDEEKEKYFIKAEQQIEAAGFTDFLKIDKTSFGVQGQKMKVFLTPFHRADNTERVPQRYGRGRSFRGDMLFGRGGNQGHREIFISQ